MTEEHEKIWKIFIRNHWRMFSLWIAAGAAVVIGAILVFLWFVGDAQATGLVPEMLGLWNIRYLLTFVLYALFWEAVCIGIPAAVAAGLIYLFWWKALPEEERAEYKRRHLFGSKSRTRDGGGMVSFLVTMGFLLKVYLDGNWGLVFSEWSLDYLVYSYLTVFAWFALIAGIPLLIGLVWWIHSQIQKSS